VDVGAATSLPFPDAWFGLVVCQQRRQVLGDRASVLAEMWRVLVPGGRVAVAVRALRRSPAFAALAGAGRAPRLAACVDPRLVHMDSGHCVSNRAR